jgi:hypothetical protein
MIELFDVGSSNTGTGLPLRDAFLSINSNLQDLQNQVTVLAEETELGYRSPMIIFVATDGNDGNNGHSFGEPFATLEQAIEEAWAIHEAESNVRVLIKVASGNYTLSNLPYRVPAFTSIMGDSLRSVTLFPAVGEERNGFFKVDDGFYMWGLTFRGHQADDEKQAWVVQFDDEADNTHRGATSLGAYITASPYFQNCSSITAEDGSGLAPTISTGDTGNGILVDREACAENTPIASIVLDSFTQINMDGIGCLVRNDAYAQLVSFFGTFCRYHVLAETGGQVNFTGGTTDFGTYGLVADGYSKTPLYTAKSYKDHYGVRRSENTFTVESSNNLQFTAHGLTNGSPVTVKSASNLPLQPTLTAGTVYYVVNATANTIKLSATVGGAAVTLDDTGAYTNFITVTNQGELTVLCKEFTPNRIGSKSRPGNGVLMFAPLVFPRLGSQASGQGLDPKGIVLNVEQYGSTRLAVTTLDTSPAIVGKHEYVPGTGTVTVTRTGIFVDSEGNTIVTTPVAGLNTFEFNVTSIDYDHLTGFTKFSAENYIPNVLDEFYFTDCEFICPLSAYTVVSAEPINEFGNVVAETDNPYGYRVQLFNATNGGLIYPINTDAKLSFYRRSQISAPSHVFEYVGSGVDYSALPENGGVPQQALAYQELNNGRVFLSWTNEKGDFGVSNRFLVDGTNGEVTISASSFNLSGLNQIGPFSRNGGLSTVGVQLKEVSDNINMVSSLGVPDANTAPTQSAVVTYINQQLTQGLPNGAIVNDTAFYFAGTSPFPTVRIDSTPIKVGDVLWDKVNRTWTSYDGTGWNNNPTIQNGFYQFVQNTKPTQRAVGVPLVAGDRWFKTNDQTEWSWNGTYWLSPQKSSNLLLSGTISADTSQLGELFDIPPAITSLLFVGAKITAVSVLPINPTGANGESNSSTNYWTFFLGYEARTNSGNTVYTVSTQGITVGTGSNSIFALEVANQPIANTVSTSYFRQRVNFVKTGSPPNLSLSFGYGGVIFYYHWIA